MNYKIKNLNGNKGFRLEKLIIKYIQEKKFEVTRNDKHDLRKPDLMINVPLDVKGRFIPFHNAEKFIGIAPEKCVTIDTEKLGYYIRKGENTLLLFYVDYRPHYETHGVFLTDAFTITRICNKDRRRVGDFQDHEKDRMIKRAYISIDEMEDISSRIRPSIVENFLLKTTNRKKEITA